MKIRIPTRSGFVSAEGSPLAVARLLWRLLPLILARPGRAADMISRLAREAEYQGLNVRRWRGDR